MAEKKPGHFQTIKEAVASDPLGCEFVVLAAIAHGYYGKQHYIVDGLEHGEKFSRRLHPDFAVPRGLPGRYVLLDRLEELKGSLGDTDRDQALRMRTDGLVRMARNWVGRDNFPVAEIVKTSYGFDPRELPKATEDDVVGYAQHILDSLPEKLRPSSGIKNKKALAEAWRLFVNSLRLPQANRYGTTRAAYAQGLVNMVRGQTRLFGLDLATTKITPVHPASSGLSAFLTYYPRNPNLDINFYQGEDLQPLPPNDLVSTVHELGHLLHLRQMRQDAIKSGHTENMVYCVFGPQAVTEGIADGLAYLLYPDADSLFDASLERYHQFGVTVNQGYLRYYVNCMRDPSFYKPTFLSRQTRMRWSLYLGHDANRRHLGQEQADDLFVRDYSDWFLTSEQSALQRLDGLKGLGPYTFSYDFYRALVARKLLRPGIDQGEQLKALCSWLPTDVPSPRQLSNV